MAKPFGFTVDFIVDIKSSCRIINLVKDCVFISVLSIVLMDSPSFSNSVEQRSHLYFASVPGTFALALAFCDFCFLINSSSVSLKVATGSFCE